MREIPVVTLNFHKVQGYHSLKKNNNEKNTEFILRSRQNWSLYFVLTESPKPLNQISELKNFKDMEIADFSH